MNEGIKERIENLLYPELRPYRRAERDRLLRKAAETQLDMLEWLGILVGMVVAAGVTRYSAVDLGSADRFAIAVANFIIAVPLLVVTVGPFLVRRKRRGLRYELEKRR